MNLVLHLSDHCLTQNYEFTLVLPSKNFILLTYVYVSDLLLEWEKKDKNVIIFLIGNNVNEQNI